MFSVIVMMTHAQMINGSHGNLNIYHQDAMSVDVIGWLND